MDLFNIPFFRSYEADLGWIIRTVKAYTKKIDDLYNFGLYDYVEKVLEAHPEWTTTVMDGAISTVKLANDAVTKPKLADGITNYLPLNYSNVRYTGSGGDTTVWYAKIPAQYKPNLYLAHDNVDMVEDLADMAERNKTTIAINAGVFNTNTKETTGYIIADGNVRKNTPSGGISSYYLVMLEDGTLDAISETQPLSDITALDPVFCVRGFQLLRYHGSNTGQKDNTLNPRTFIAQNSAGDYFIGICDGRDTDEAGFNSTDIIDFIDEYFPAATFILNLDGGGSVNLNYKGYRCNDLIEGSNRYIANMIGWKEDVTKFTDTFETANVGTKRDMYLEHITREHSEILRRVDNLMTGTKITANSNLNDYIQPGIYVCESNAIAASLSNCPTNQGFIMIVRSSLGYFNFTGTWNYLRREILPYSDVTTWKQGASSDGSGVYTFTTWHRYDEYPTTAYATNPSNISEGTPRYIKADKVVTLFNMFKAGTVPNNTIIADGLPKPFGNAAAFGVFIPSDGSAIKLAQVTVNGELKCPYGLTANTYYTPVLTYITEKDD